MELPLDFLYSPRLVHFLAIVEHRNLRVAADAVGISQPALTKNLRILETQLDVKLFTRSSSGMMPTTAAEVLLQHIEQISDHSRGLELELSELRGAGKGLIRLGAGHMWSRLFIPEIVSEFLIKYPEVNLEITTGPMPNLVQELKNGTLDVVVGDFDAIHVSSDYSIELAWSSQFWAFAGAEHELARQERVQVSDLVKHAWTGYVDGDVFARKVGAFCEEFNVEQPKISVRATTLATLLKITRDSGNIVLLPKELEEEALQSDLIPLRLENPTLWAIDTGSIIDARKTTLRHYETLLSLIKSVGSKQKH